MDYFNNILGTKTSLLDSIKNPSDKSVATDFVKFICAISENSRPISIEIKRSVESGQYIISARFPKGTSLKWLRGKKSEIHGLGELIDVNERIFDDCCIVHEEKTLLVELVMNKISAPHFHSHHSIKVKTARKNVSIIQQEDIHNSGSEKVFQNDPTEFSGNSETFRFNDIPLAFIKNQLDRLNVENFSRWGRIFAEGQYRVDMEVTQIKKGTYCVHIMYPANSFFGWNRLATFPAIQPFYFENMSITHTEKGLSLRIFVKNSDRRLFVDQNESEMIILTVRRKRHRHLPSLTTEIVYDNNEDSSTSDEDEDDDYNGNNNNKQKMEINMNLLSGKYRKVGK